MPIIKASTNDNTNLFLLDGLDQNRGAFILYYDSVEKNSSGVIDETKIRIGLRSKYRENEILITPQLRKYWSNGVTIFGNTSATGTVTSASPVANTFATGTVTLSGVTALVAATGTIQFNSALADDTVTVNGLVYTAVAGSKAGDFTKFSIDTDNDAAAVDLADSITNDVRVGTLDDVTATSSTDTVTATQTVAGASGNATTLTSTGGLRVVLSGAVFTGGTEATTVTVNGLTYTGVAGTRADATEFSVDTSDAAAGIDLVAAVTADRRIGTLGDISATDNGAGVVTFTTDVLGTGGNVVTLASGEAISGALLTGGVDADTVTVNGEVYTAVAGARPNNITFSIDSTDTATATDLAAAITADTREATANMTAVGAVAIVTITQTLSGTDGNTIPLSSSSVPRLAVSAALFANGVDGTLNDAVAAISPLIV